MIYLASSWRNPYQQALVAALRQEGFAVYDFRHPAPDNHGFHWREIDTAWQQWTRGQWRTALRHEVAVRGFACDMKALRACTTCLLVAPCGRSAHLELGYAVGAKKRTICYLPPGTDQEPELMYKMVDHIVLCENELLAVLRA